MKVALLSDIHLGVRKNSDIFLKSQINFLKNEFVPYLLENDIKTVFWLGDLFDNRSSINTKVMNSFFEFFDEYMKKIFSYIIIGNHDTYYNSSIKVNSLKFLDVFENVELIEEMKMIEIEGRKITLVPWIVDHIEFIKKFQKFNGDVCMGHFNISGFKFNKYKTSENGMNEGLFGKYSKVFSGHFHIRNSKSYEGSEIIYIGSPYQLTRNDINEKRGFTILDLDNLEHDFVDNDVSLKYIKLKYPERFSEKRIKNNIIDVHISYDDFYNENEISKYISKIENYNPALQPNIFVDSNPELEGEINLKDYNIGSIMDLVKEYIDSTDILEKAEVYKILNDLYNETRGDEL